MFLIIVVNIVFKKSKFLKKKFLNTENDQAHFSNAIGFSFALSILVDIMYWKTIYSPASIHGTADFVDALLMHAAITVVFSIWLMAEKRSPFGKQRKSFKNGWQSFGWRAVVPIVSITLLYMGWTALGQTLTDNPIYSDVIDWKKDLGTTFKTFLMAFIVLSAIVLAYNYAFPKLFKCFCGNHAIDPSTTDNIPHSPTFNATNDDENAAQLSSPLLQINKK